MLKKIMIALIGLLILAVIALTFIRLPAPSQEIEKEISPERSRLSSSAP